jgi:hypothetical protein
MSPVKQSNPRSAALAIGGALLAIVGVAALVIFALQQGSSTGDVEVRLGSDRFDAGSAEARADSIAEDGPILLPDPSGRDRDIYLQHIGDSPEVGWLAFDARRPGAGRECTLEWKADADQFVDPCDGTIVAPDGAGLIAYKVEVTDDGTVVIDFR